MRPLRPLAAALLLLLALAPAARAAQEETPKTPGPGEPAPPAAAPEEPAPKKVPARPGAYYNRYTTSYLDAYAAQAVAWEQCPRKEACQIQGLAQARGAVLDITTDAATHERINRALAARDVPRTQGFQLVLLAAGDKPDGAGPGLYKGAQKALDDIKGFLPFKSYRILDTALLRVTQGEIVRGQVKGLSPAPYQVALRFRATGAGEKLFLDHFELKEPRTQEELIQTSFAMNVGETVVVGTSSATGSTDALVALLTAMP